MAGWWHTCQGDLRLLVPELNAIAPGDMGGGKDGRWNKRSNRAARQQAGLAGIAFSPGKDGGRRKTGDLSARSDERRGIKSVQDDSWRVRSHHLCCLSPPRRPTSTINLRMANMDRVQYVHTTTVHGLVAMLT